MHDIFVIICIEFFWGKKENEIQVIVFVIYIYYRYNPFCIKFFNYCIIFVTLFGSFYLMPMFLQTRQMIMKIIVKLLILMFVTKTDKLLDSINKSKTLQYSFLLGYILYVDLANIISDLQKTKNQFCIQKVIHTSTLPESVMSRAFTK